LVFAQILGSEVRNGADNITLQLIWTEPFLVYEVDTIVINMAILFPLLDAVKLVSLWGAVKAMQQYHEKSGNRSSRHMIHHSRNALAFRSYRDFL